MATDIFGYNSNTRSNFRKLDNYNLIMGKGGGIRLIQNWNVSYAQQVVPVYECGSADVWFAGANPVGQMSVQRIVGPEGSDATSAFGTLCSPGSCTINMSSGCNKSSGGGTLTLNGCITTAVNWSGQAQQAVIQEGVTVQFTSLTKK